MSDRVVVIRPEPERVVVIGNVVAGAAAAHPDLAAHDLLGLATQIELDAHAATAGHTHPNLAAHDALGLATQLELNAKSDTTHGHPGPDLSTYIAHDGTPAVGDWLRVKSVNPLVVERDPGTVRRTTVTTAAYTAAIGDAGKVVRMTFAGASTLTIPANATAAFPIDTIINPYAAGGALTIAAAAGVTIRNNGAALAQNGECSLRKDGTDEWVRVG